MIVNRLKDLGYSYSPAPLKPQGFPFNSAVRVGNLVFTSGQVPFWENNKIQGKVGGDIDIEEAKKAAEICAFNCIRAAGSVCDIESISRVVKVFGMVNCSEKFNDTSSIINGASEFFISAFGEKGMHARSAVGMQLPSDWAVEVEAVFEVID